MPSTTPDPTVLALAKIFCLNGDPHAEFGDQAREHGDILPDVLAHGSISPVDLSLPPSLGAALVSTCHKHLDSKAMTRSRNTSCWNGNRPKDTEILLRQHLEALPSHFGLEADTPITINAQSKATSDGTLECELSSIGSCVSREGGEDSTLMLCGVCRSVTYCSTQHQRADWKTHKEVCFAPSW